MKIFVVDPALKDQRGHHYALTANISRNCAALGHKVICLVNKSLSKQTDDDLYFVRCFSSDTYDGHAKPKAPVKAPAAPAQPAPGKAAPAPALAAASSATPDKAPKARPQNSTASAPNSATQKPDPGLIMKVKHGCIALYRFLPVSVREITTPMFHKWRNGGPLPAVAPASAVANGTAVPAPAPTPNPVAELLGSLRSHSAGPQDVVLFHTSDAHTYRDIVELFVKSVPVEKWNTLPQFHLSTPYDGSTMPHNRKHPPFNQSVRHLSRLGLIGTKVFLRAEHVLLAEHLSEVLENEVKALPIPPLTDLPLRAPSRSEASMNVMYLGAARTEKGFTTLPPAIRATLAKSPALDVHFHIQITPQILGYTPDVLKAVEDLREIEDDRLHLIDKPLSQDGYLQLLANADVMLLNYDPERYRFRGSGIAVESVLSATSLITPKATFPGYIGGDSGVRTDHPGGIEDALQEIYDNLEEFRAKATARRDWYLAEHSAKKFTNVLQTPVCQLEIQIRPQSHRYQDDTQWQPLL